MAQPKSLGRRGGKSVVFQSDEWGESGRQNPSFGRSDQVERDVAPCSHPVPSPGTQLDPESLKVVVTLQVGETGCERHKCRCNRMLGHHGLTCRFSAGHSQRRTALNDVVKRPFQQAGVPSVLEPLGLNHGESVSPDG